MHGLNGWFTSENCFWKLSKHRISLGSEPAPSKVLMYGSRCASVGRHLLIRSSSSSKWSSVFDQSPKQCNFAKEEVTCSPCGWAMWGGPISVYFMHTARCWQVFCLLSFSAFSKPKINAWCSASCHLLCVLGSIFFLHNIWWGTSGIGDVVC